VHALQAGGNDAAAVRVCAKIVDNDPGSVRDRLAYLRALVRARRFDDAARTARDIAEDDRFGEAAQRDARERLADLAWMGGDDEEARRAYEALLADAPTQDDARILTVKALGAADPQLGPTLRAFLLDDGRAAPSPIAIYLLQGLLARVPDHPVVHYLLGRQLWNQGKPELARAHFETADRAGLPERLAAENLRLLGQCAWRAGDRSAARATFERLTEPEHALGVREEAYDWLDRLEWEHTGRVRARRAL
jgi:tetratricopeptide (TPR) repeat protein